MARFEFKMGEDTPKDWFQGDAPVLSLPDEHAPLKEQRAAMRALTALFPEADITLLSHTDLEDGSTVTRTVKMDIKHPKKEG